MGKRESLNSPNKLFDDKTIIVDVTEPAQPRRQWAEPQAEGYFNEASFALTKMNEAVTLCELLTEEMT